MADVRVSGPLFDGRAEAALHDFAEDAKRAVAGQGYAEVMTNLNASIRHPTPYYETQINVEPQGDAQVVNDRGIIYGPWLEGVGSRNDTTRFKGYSSFRRAWQTLQGKASGIAERTLAKYLSRMQ